MSHSKINNAGTENELELSYNSLKDTVSSFPTHDSYKDLRLYHGFYLREAHLPRILWCHRNFKASPNDILLATYPKSGTTWIKAMTFAIINRSTTPPYANLTHHPLLTLHPQLAIPCLERLFSTPQIPDDLDAIPPPRVFATHIPYSLLPPSARACRFVYVGRDPKDILTSGWHFSKQLRRNAPDLPVFNLTIHDFTDRFIDGTLGYGSPWKHRMEYWKESLERPDKVLFLEYEKMLREPEECVRRLAKFMGRPFSDEEEKEGVVGDIVKLCSIDFLKSLEVNRDGVLQGPGEDWTYRRSDFFRKGKSGGWNEELSPELAEKVDSITQRYQSKMMMENIISD